MYKIWIGKLEEINLKNKAFSPQKGSKIKVWQNYNSSDKNFLPITWGILLLSYVGNMNSSTKYDTLRIINYLDVI